MAIDATRGRTDPKAGPQAHGIRLSESQMGAALDALARNDVLTAEQAEQVRVALMEQAAGPARTRLWVEIAGYLGGVLMLGGGMLVIGRAWERMSDLTRSGVLAAVTLALIAAALLVAGNPATYGLLRQDHTSTRRRISAVLLALSAGSAAGAAGVLAHAHTSLVVSVVGLIVAGIGYTLLRAIPGLVACAIASFGLASAIAMEISSNGPTASAVSLIILGAAWLLAALLNLATPVGLGYGIGSLVALIGAQELGGGRSGLTASYLTTFALAVAFLLLYRAVRSTTLLVAGVLATAIAAPEAVWDLTGGAAGGAAILLSAGAVLVVASVYGVRRRGGGRREQGGMAAGQHHGDPDGQEARSDGQPVDSGPAGRDL